MLELVQVTVQYSHAVLAAVLPYISDFSQKLDLPVATPITTNGVSAFKCDPRQGEVGGAVTLTNGCQFVFLDGRVTLYRSPSSYFSLQDPDLLPRLYGAAKLTEAQSEAIAVGIINKLGYEKAIFNATKPPSVTQPEKIGTNLIPRYRFRWLDPNFPRPEGAAAAASPALLDIEVNAENGRVELVAINSRYTRRPSPKVDVVLPLLHSKKSEANSQGTPTKAVSAGYAAAFFDVVLQEIADFRSKSGLSNAIPASVDRAAVTNYICRFIDGKPIAQLYLKTGDRFNYEHGHIEAFYAHDAMDKFPQTGNTSDFLGHINLTTNEAISLCTQVIRQMGYTNRLLPPIISYAPGMGPLVCTRYTYYWSQQDVERPFAAFEVDMETTNITSVVLRDPAFERESPRIDVQP